MKALSCSLFPSFSSVLLALRIHSNDMVIKHLSERPRSKFQERFACPISTGWKGQAGRGCCTAGTQPALKRSGKNTVFEKVPVDAVTPHCLAVPRTYFLILQPMVFKDSPSLLGKGEGENLEEILAEKVKLSHFTQKVLQSSWLITVTVKTISRPPIQSFPGH